MSASRTINTTMGATEWGLLFLLGLVWGATLFFVEIALEDLPPVTIAFIRVLSAGLILTALAYLMGHRLPLAPAAWGALFIMGLLNNAVPFSLIMWGQTQITGSLAAILNATTPLFTVVVAHFLTRDEKLNATKVIGIMFGIAGVVVMIGIDALAGLGLNVIAQLSVMSAGIVYAFAAIYGRRFQDQPPIVTASGQLIASAIWLMPYSLLVDHVLDLPAPGLDTWMAMAGMAILSTALAYVIYFRILASSGATNILLATFLVPLSAIFLGFVFLGERLEIQHIIGLGLIAFGLFSIDGRLFRRLKTIWY